MDILHWASQIWNAPRIFYFVLLEEQGAKAQFDGGRIAMIGKSMSQLMVAVCEPYNGKPGQRIPNIFYGAYIRDQDGNKFAFRLCLRCFKPDLRVAAIAERFI